MRIPQLIAVAAVCCALEGTAAAQGMLVASLGRTYGGSAVKTSGTYAIGVGGGGARGIGSELEYSQTSHFTDTAGQESKVLSLMASLFLAVPIAHGTVRPYGIFGYGFIRQRTPSSSGSALSNLSNNDVGYGVGAGVIYKFSRAAGVRADLRHFKVRKADGLSFQRLTVGFVLGG